MTTELDLHAELVDFRRPFELELEAFGTLVVQGIEVTQAIQYYRSAAHLTDPADRQPDNSVTLIAGKPAWARVYVRIQPLVVTRFAHAAGGFSSAGITGVTGSLTVSRRHLGVLFVPIGVLTPEPPGTVTAHLNPDYATERGTLNATLNFRIPTNMMCGTLRLRADVTAPGGRTATRSVTLDVTLRQTLRLAGVMVGYNGPSSGAAGAPNVNLPAPTVTDLQTTSAYTLKTFPVRSFATYRSAGTVTWTLPLTDPPSCGGCCSPNWVALNNAVQAQVVADGNKTDVLYYGLMATGIPMGPVVGCNTGTVSTGSQGAGVTMAHELGHRCGLPHAPCGTAGDPLYPAYEPYDPAGTPMASIGEYGLDIDNGNIFSPATFKDYMSYCGPGWISLYNYGRLTNHPALAPARTCQDHIWWRELIEYERLRFDPSDWLPDPTPDPPWLERLVNPEPVISLIGIVHAEHQVEITSIMRLDAVPEVTGGLRTELSAELIGDDGASIASATVYRLRSHGHCECDEADGGAHYPYSIQAFIPNVDRGAALRIRAGDEEIWSRSAPRRKPRATGFTAEYDKRGQLRVGWSSRTEADADTEGWLQWSSDGGESWNALTTGLRGQGAVVDASSLPPGRVQLRLLFSDGFDTATSRKVSVTVPRRAPEVAILAPREGQVFFAGSSMRLWGMATGIDGSGDRVDATWSVDGKAVGDGLDLYVEAPPAGDHTAELAVSTRAGRGRASVEFRTVDFPKEPIVDRRAPSQYLCNTNSMEVHDLRSEEPQCQIDKIIEARHAVAVDPDTLSQAHREGFDNCAYCIGGSTR